MEMEAEIVGDGIKACGVPACGVLLIELPYFLRIGLLHSDRA
jgi:hypothetical protein